MAVMNGTIKRLVSDKGFGFIAASDGNEYFFHQSACTDARFDDLREGQAVFVDESLERGIVAVPRDPDELHPAGPPLACRFDRRGFMVAGHSSGRPEPQQHRLARVLRQIDGASSNLRRDERQ